MSTNLPEQQASEEVDLGQLFKLIGNAFQRFFDFIAFIFKGLFNLILLILIHFYNRFKWYAGALVIGLVLGYFLDKSSEKSYGANMIIETNFNSAYQVYENIKNLHELAAVDRDSVELARILKIEVADAAKLKGFFINPSADQSDNVELFTPLYEQLDSVSKIEISFTTFVESLESHSYNKHQIGVISADKTIYSKLGAFKTAISTNEYLTTLLEGNLENLKREEQTLITQDSKIDELVSKYLEIRVKESDKIAAKGSGTNLYMGNAEQNGLLVDEAKLIQEKLVLQREVRRVNRDLIEKQAIISVLSDFPSTGYDISTWSNKKKYQMPILMIGLTLFLFIILGLGKYLKAEEKRIYNK